MTHTCLYRRNHEQPCRHTDIGTQDHEAFDPLNHHNRHHEHGKHNEKGEHEIEEFFIGIGPAGRLAGCVDS